MSMLVGKHIMFELLTLQEFKAELTKPLSPTLQE